MTGLLPRLYAASPVWLQHVEVSAFGLVWRQRRFGGRFRDMTDEFLPRERWSSDAWHGYQTNALRQTLAHAHRSVPYYRAAWDACGLDLATIEQFTCTDLHRVPRLEREALRRDPAAFLSSTARGRRIHTYHTSGTTGTPIAIRMTDDIQQTWAAVYEARVRRWAGVSHRMSRAMIGGRRIVPAADTGPPYWRYNLVERQLYMSSYHIAPSTAPYYVSALNRYRPEYLAGIASSHYFLARAMREQGLTLRFRPRTVLTSSETLTTEMRETIEQAYGCQVFDAYAGVECCGLACECEHHRLHISPDVGVIEVLAEDGRPCEPGEPGEIVATGFLNRVQPLIRYRTGDLAIVSPDLCRCGRRMPVLAEVVGRLEDAVIKADGGELVRFDGLFKGLPHIREGQLVQEQLSSFRVRLAVDPGFGDDDRTLIRQRLGTLLGPISIAFELVDRIERTERGKFRAVISKVPRLT